MSSSKVVSNLAEVKGARMLTGFAIVTVKLNSSIRHVLVFIQWCDTSVLRRAQYW